MAGQKLLLCGAVGRWRCRCACDTGPFSQTPRLVPGLGPLGAAGGMAGGSPLPVDSQEPLSVQCYVPCAAPEVSPPQCRWVDFPRAYTSAVSRGQGGRTLSGGQERRGHLGSLISPSTDSQLIPPSLGPNLTPAMHDTWYLQFLRLLQHLPLVPLRRRRHLSFLCSAPSPFISRLPTRDTLCLLPSLPFFVLVVPHM